MVSSSGYTFGLCARRPYLHSYRCENLSSHISMFKHFTPKKPVIFFMLEV
jgi:hypothetical protein